MARVIQKPSGAIGIKFGAALIGDREALRKLATLSGNIQKKILRFAVAAGARPVAAAVHKAAKAASAASRRHEGIGTTSRAVASKAAMSKRDPWRAYAVVGVRRGYYEIAQLRAGRSAGHSGAVKSVKKYQQRRNRRGTKASVAFRSLEKFTPTMRKARLRPTKGHDNSNKRVPSRYLHLQERGRYKTPPTWKRLPPPNAFVAKTAAAKSGEALQKMSATLKAGIEREAQRLART